MEDVGTITAAGYHDEDWQSEGDPFKCCLYSPKGSEIPQPLAMLDRTIFGFAWVDETVPVTPQKRVIVAGVTYEIHQVPDERTNKFLPMAFVSRLK